MEWHSIETECPFEGENVLIYMDDEIFIGSLFFDEEKDAYWNTLLGKFDATCSLWMPLPNPPIPFKTVCKEK